MGKIAREYNVTQPTIKNWLMRGEKSNSLSSSAAVTKCPPNAAGDPGISEYHKMQDELWKEKHQQRRWKKFKKQTTSDTALTSVASAGR